MKKSFCFLLIAGLFTLGSCGGGTTGTNSDSVDSAKDLNEQKDTSGMMPSNDTAAITTPVDKDAADFAVETTSSGMMEIELGKMAQEKASSQRVKDFGAMMVRDHTEAANKLKQIASNKNITLPAQMGDKEMKHVEDLSKKTGKDFDKAFMDMMLDDHKAAIKDFENTADKCKDPDLKNFAMQTLPTLQVHLDSAKAITGKK